MLPFTDWLERFVIPLFGVAAALIWILIFNLFRCDLWPATCS